MLDFIRIGCAVPPVSVGDVQKNTEDVLRKIRQADAQGCDVVVFPELALTGYTCADLFFQETLLSASVAGIARIIEESTAHPGIVAVVGVPLVIAGQMYNCGAVISGGVLRGIVPKTYLPNYSEFYERRWFSSSMDSRAELERHTEQDQGGHEEGSGCREGWTHQPAQSGT